MGIDSYTKALLHLNGADSSTVFTDLSGKTWTAVAPAQLKTAQYKFSPSSLYCDGSGACIQTPDHADFTVGSGDWTVDCWFKTSVANKYIFGQANSGGTTATMGLFGLTDGTGKMGIGFSTGGALYQVYSTAAGFADGNWHHFAGIRYGNNMYVAADGTLSAPQSITGLSVNDSGYKFAIGALGESAGTPFNGYIDEFRFSKGIARWTTNFTPPTKAYGGGLFTFHG